MHKLKQNLRKSNLLQLTLNSDTDSDSVNLYEYVLRLPSTTAKTTDTAAAAAVLMHSSFVVSSFLPVLTGLATPANAYECNLWQ
ncbi:unnamed protein product [Ceratitis capitata]|uniref:(Mediterranean fruit fly) hypothetical protein n=1 Tax=Ceratitis capitata TaxID=7213 RepID=A0A811U3A7_CERCA|nr:unnamed protein product [Ceratitis capitata]